MACGFQPKIKTKKGMGDALEEIFTAKHEDQRKVFEFHKKNFLDASPTEDFRQIQLKSVDEDLHSLSSSEFDQNMFFCLKNLNNDIIGVIGLSIGTHEKKSTKLHSFSVDPSCRNRGFGSKLMNYAIEYAKSQKSERIELCTATHLIDAIKLYEKFGFVLMQNGPLCYGIDGEWTADVPASYLEEHPGIPSARELFFELLL